MRILKRMTSWELVIYSIDNIEQMILLCGLELLRFGARTHSRGILLGTAGRLDHMLSLVRAVLVKGANDTELDCADFADTTKTKVTALFTH